MDGKGQLAAELKELLRRSGGVAEAHPRATVHGHRAVQQAHALVVQHQVKIAVLANLQSPETDLARLDAELGGVQNLAGQPGQELIQAAVAIGKVGGDAGRLSQIDPPQAAEETFQVAFFQKLPGPGPIFIAGDGQFIEVAAGTTRGEHKGTGEGSIAGRDRAAIAGVMAEDAAVIEAVTGVLRIDARTLAASLAMTAALPGETNRPLAA